MEQEKYTVVRDTQEKANFWTFDKSGKCNGTEIEKLPTGDYTLRGLEKIFTIERKGKLAEFSANISQKRFERELIRLEQFKYPFIVLEFTMDDITRFPFSTDIPPRYWGKIRVTAPYIIKKLIYFDTNYKTKIILAGKHGKKIAEQIFTQVLENEAVKK